MQPRTNWVNCVSQRLQAHVQVIDEQLQVQLCTSIVDVCARDSIDQKVQSRRHESALVAGQFKLALWTPSLGTQIGLQFQIICHVICSDGNAPIFSPTSCLNIYVGLVLYLLVVTDFEMTEINAVKSSIMLGIVPKIVVHYYTDVTSSHCFWSKYFCYLYLQCWLFSYGYGLCNLVRIHGIRMIGYAKGLVEAYLTN